MEDEEKIIMLLSIWFNYKCKCFFVQKVVQVPLRSESILRERLVHFLECDFRECDFKKYDSKELKFKKSDFVIFGILKKF